MYTTLRRQAGKTYKLSNGESTWKVYYSASKNAFFARNLDGVYQDMGPYDAALLAVVDVRKLLTGRCPDCTPFLK